MTSASCVGFRRWSAVWLAAGCLCLALAFGAPIGAQDLSCTELCDAAQAFQGYGTGSDDYACLAVCNGTARDCSNDQGSDLWGQYFDCLNHGVPAEECQPSYVDAKECSVCDHGLVAPWDAADMVWVNGPDCLTQGPQVGTLLEPFCDVYQGLDAAITRQGNGQDTKVLVCEGVYREGYEKIHSWKVNTPGTAKIVVEAVTKGSAVISGSEDWSGAWLPQPETIVETIHNELHHSTDLSDPSWAAIGVGVGEEWIPDPPSFAATPPFLTKVFRIAPIANAEATTALYLWQEIPYLEDKLATFSMYVRPDRATRFKMDFRIHVGDDPVTQEPILATGASYTFQLPPEPLCGIDSSSGADGVGIEPAGPSWYRVHVTARVDTPPNMPTRGVARVRFHLVGPLGEGDGAQIFAPELDHRPLDEFETTPREPLLTQNAPVHATQTTVKNFYVNDASKKTWAHDWGLARHHPFWGELPPLMRRAEMIFIDDQPLRQELSPVDMEPGSFEVDDEVVYGGYNHKKDNTWVSGKCSEIAPCPIRILPPPGVDMNKAKVEVAVQPRLLWLTETHDWELRGLTFEHATGAYDLAQQGGCLGEEPKDCRLPLTNSAVGFENSLRLALRENRVHWNSPFGLAVLGLAPNPGNDILLSHNMVVDNGTGGEYFAATRGFLVDGEEFSRNNWRGRRTGVMRHANSGAKYSTLAEGTINGIIAQDNYGHGLWFDYENQALTVESCIVSNNTGTGIYFEANDVEPDLAWPNPIFDPTTTVRWCLVDGNDVGVKGISSRLVTLEENVILGNETAILLTSIPRVEVTVPPNPPKPPKNLREWTIESNEIFATCSHHLWLHYGDLLGLSDYGEWQPFMESLTSAGNDYSHPQGYVAKGFVIRDVSATLPEWQGCIPGNEPWCFKTPDMGSGIVP